MVLELDYHNGKMLAEETLCQYFAEFLLDVFL